MKITSEWFVILLLLKISPFECLSKSDTEYRNRFRDFVESVCNNAKRGADVHFNSLNCSISSSSSTLNYLYEYGER